MKDVFEPIGLGGREIRGIGQGEGKGTLHSKRIPTRKRIRLRREKRKCN